MKIFSRIFGVLLIITGCLACFAAIVGGDSSSAGTAGVAIGGFTFVYLGIQMITLFKKKYD